MAQLRLVRTAALKCSGRGQTEGGVADQLEICRGNSMYIKTVTLRYLNQTRDDDAASEKGSAVICSLHLSVLL